MTLLHIKKNQMRLTKDFSAHRGVLQMCKTEKKLMRKKGDFVFRCSNILNINDFGFRFYIAPHAVKRMAERNISFEMILETINLISTKSLCLFFYLASLDKSESFKVRFMDYDVVFRLGQNKISLDTVMYSEIGC